MNKEEKTILNLNKVGMFDFLSSAGISPYRNYCFAQCDASNIVQ